MEEIAVVRFYAYTDGESISWVQSTADMAPDVKLHWRQREIVLSPAPEGTDDIAGDEETQALVRSVEHWMSLNATCDGPNLTVGATSAGSRARYDQINRVIYRHDSWDNEFSCDKQFDVPVAYDPDAIALTTLCYGTKSGEIYDADIEMNAVGRALAICNEGGDCTTTDNTSAPYDLESVLTHELGHFFGLDHTCWTPKTPGMTQPVDDTGQPVPLCTEATDPEIFSATMFPRAQPNDVSLRTLEQDDADGFCGMYADNDWRDDESGCGCAVGGAGGPGFAGALPLIIGALGVLAMLRGRR